MSNQKEIEEETKMMQKRKSYLIFALAACMVLGSAFTAQAADTKIDKVRLTFSYDREPKSGEDIGNIHVKTDSNEFRVDYAEYTNDVDTWSVGDEPTVRVELTAKDGYRFYYKSKSHYTLSGCSAEFKDADIYDSGSYMELTVTLKRVGGKLSGAENLEWSGTTAYWDEVEGSKNYEVKLMRDERTVTTVETTSTAYDFGGYINKEGTYTFKVRAISNYNNRVGEWSEESPDYDVDEEDTWRTGRGRWIADQNGWWYAYDGGGYPAACWKQIDNVWYYFNRSGYMATGWQRIDGTWYYLAPSGAMTTGWQNVNGVWYYMDGSGAMQTGWEYVGGKWYYLGDNGAMYANTTTPDGHYVDGSGARVY